MRAARLRAHSHPRPGSRGDSRLVRDPLNAREWPRAPHHPGPPGPDLHVWRVDLAACDEGDGVALLSSDEWARAARLVSAGARTRFSRARIALRRLLAEYVRLSPGELALEYGEHGKPRLARETERDRTPLFFNLSHSGDLALFAVGEAGEIGVDIERIRPLRHLEGLARDHLSAGERELRPDWSAIEARPEFFRVWARKEAMLKAAGLGLSRPLSRVDTIRGLLEGRPYWLLDLLPGDGFAGAVACTRAPAAVRRWSWP
ncbi:4'-phosphopantetheinyl transferase superfamily protein [Candidatus Palauibacter sp.]|uniref:4'-phosphopantetheinyl transferase family protein n=1 Tax=Candidatus Palauibacter sp. TaxID=3101350 RepID=UPI003B01A654